MKWACLYGKIAHMCGQILNRAVVVAQLVEWSLPTKTYCLR